MQRRSLLVGTILAGSSGLVGVSVLSTRPATENGTTVPFAVDDPVDVPAELEDGTVVRGRADVPVYDRTIDEDGVEYVGTGEVVVSDPGLVRSNEPVPFDTWARTFGERRARRAVSDYLRVVFDETENLAVGSAHFDAFEDPAVTVVQGYRTRQWEDEPTPDIPVDRLIEESPKTVYVLVAITRTGATFEHVSRLRHASAYPVFVREQLVELL